MGKSDGTEAAGGEGGAGVTTGGQSLGLVGDGPLHSSSAGPSALFSTGSFSGWLSKRFSTDSSGSCSGPMCAVGALTEDGSGWIWTSSFLTFGMSTFGGASVFTCGTGNSGSSTLGTLSVSSFLTGPTFSIGSGRSILSFFLSSAMSSLGLTLVVSANFSEAGKILDFSSLCVTGGVFSCVLGAAASSVGVWKSC